MDNLDPCIGKMRHQCHPCRGWEMAAAVRFADAIVSLSEGRVAEHGAHESLVAAQGYYAQVHRLQELDHAV